MYTIKVTTNGDDYGFESDRFLWRAWIYENITPTGYRVNASKEIATAAIIEFENEHDLTVFALTRPEYVTYDLIRGRYQWILGETGPATLNT